MNSKDRTNTILLTVVTVLGAFVIVFILSILIEVVANRQQSLPLLNLSKRKPSCNVWVPQIKRPSSKDITADPYKVLLLNKDVRERFEDSYRNNPAYPPAGNMCSEMLNSGFTLLADYNGAADGMDNTNAFYKFYFTQSNDIEKIKDTIVQKFEDKKYETINASQRRCTINSNYASEVSKLKTIGEIKAYLYEKDIANANFFTTANKTCLQYHGGQPYWVVTAKTPEGDRVTATITNQTYEPFQIADDRDISKNSWLEKPAPDGRSVAVLQWSYHGNIYNP